MRSLHAAPPLTALLPSRYAAACLLALGLAGCSTPLPPPEPRAAPPAPVVVAPPPAPAVEPAVALPVTPPADAEPAPLPQGEAPEAVFSAAVQARFPAPPVDYHTPAFESGRTTYTSNAELRTLMHAIADESRSASDPTRVRLLSVGSSQRGVPLEALLFSRLSALDPASLRTADRPTVLLIGQQHGNEPAGSEALLVVARELAHGLLAPLLDRINVIVLPRVNPDGAEGGTRVSASGIDINRDHLLLRTPEAQAVALLMRDYRPTVVVDAHEYTVAGRFLEKFGAVQRYDALLQYAMTPNVHEFMTRASQQWFHEPVQRRLETLGLTSEWYYTTSDNPSDKTVSMGGVRPDTGRNVNGLKNAVSLLVESRGVGIGRQNLARRVYTQVSAAARVLQSAAERAPDLKRLRQFVADDLSAMACRGEVVLEAAPTHSEYSLVMIDPVTGADRALTVSWESALGLQPVKKRPRPCGYWLAADEVDAMLRLRALGLVVQRVDENGVLRGELYTERGRTLVDRADVRGAIADGGPAIRVDVTTAPAAFDVPVGSYYVPLDQPLANLAVAALEPDTQSSYFANHVIGRLGAVARVMLRPASKMSPMP